MAVWLLSQPGLDEREQLLDRLDLALGDCLEFPGLWGVMAGLRAIQVTDLPVQDEVEAAARGFNVEEALVMRTTIDGAALTSHPSSAHTGFTAREVVLTRVQLAGHPESPLHQELAEGLRVAEARLRTVNRPRSCCYRVVVVGFVARLSGHGDNTKDRSACPRSMAGPGSHPGAPVGHGRLRNGGLREFP